MKNESTMTNLVYQRVTQEHSTTKKTVRKQESSVTAVNDNLKVIKEEDEDADEVDGKEKEVS